MLLDKDVTAKDSEIQEPPDDKSVDFQLCNYFWKLQ